MPPPAFTGRSRWAPIFVALIALAAAWPAIRLGWSDYDEVYYCRDNLYLLSLAPGNLWTLLTSPGWGYQFQATTYLSHALDYALFGESVHAFHTVNVLLYAWVCWLVASLARELLRDLGAPPARVGWGAFLAGAFFAIHPVHVENFAWLGDRKDLLAAGFGLTAFLVIRRARRLPTPRALWALAGALVLFTVAIAAKVSVMPLGCLVILDAFLIDPVIRRLPLRQRIIRSLPAGAVFLLAGLGLSVLWVAAQQGYPIPLSREQSPLDPVYVLRCFGHYARLLAWPNQLSVHYIPRPGVLDLAWSLIALALACAAWGWLMLRRPQHRALLLLGGAWLVLHLLPVVNIVYLGYVNDRYLLAPSIGAALILGALLGDVPRRRGVGLILVALAATALFLRTEARIPDWQSGKTIWLSALEVDPTHPWANGKAAAFALEEGRAEEALEHVDRALCAAPRSPLLIGLKVRVLDVLERQEEAAALLSAAAQLPGLELFLAGRALARGDVAEAERLLTPIEANAGYDVPILTVLARFELVRKRPVRALEHCERALEIYAPVEVTWLAATAAHQAGEPAKAARYLALLERQGPSLRTSDLSSRVAADLYERAAERANAGALDAARDHLHEALRMDPRLVQRARSDPLLGRLLD